VAAVVGAPIRHSRSPAVFNAAFEACGLDWAFVAFESAAAGDVLHGARALGIRALSVTMPLKEPLAGLVERLSPAASVLGAVNSIRFDADGAAGDSTDGPGLLDALAAERDWRPAGRHCAVLGAGGAARAVVLALAGAGAASVTVVGRTPARAAAAAALAASVGRVGSAEDVRGVDAVFNATPVGMAGTPGAGASPLDDALISAGQLIVDLVYHPLRTPLLAAAERRGASTMGGLPMLVHQAARQFTWWTGAQAPLGVMAAAAAAG